MRTKPVGFLLLDRQTGFEFLVKKNPMTSPEGQLHIHSSVDEGSWSTGKVKNHPERYEIYELEVGEQVHP